MQQRKENHQITKESAGKDIAPRKRRKKGRPPTLILFVLVMLLLSLYIGIAFRFTNIFLPGTTIRGVSVSGMNLEQAEEAIYTDVQNYVLVLEERDQVTETITGKDISLCPVYDGTLEALLEAQNGLLWGICFLKETEYPWDITVNYNKDDLIKMIDQLTCMNPDLVVPPSDAVLEYDPEEGVLILPEKQGNELKAAEFFQAVSQAISRLEPWISLENSGLYKTPNITKEDAALKAQAKTWGIYTNASVMYHFGSQVEHLDGSTICQWLISDELGNVSLDTKQVEAYVKSLAQKYNTAYCTKEFKTSSGPTITITKGHYGWMIDQDAEAEALAALIINGERVEREPIYAQTAASHDGPDYGNTYVELNLTSQHLYYYKDGKLFIESDFVSGDEARGWSTPAGAYELTYKQRNATLKGKNYATPVSYWMPFNGNIGMHDGYWRSTFGGTIYKKNGSHGCVNLPPAVAKTIYENIEAATPVLCYHLKGTEKKN